MPVVVENFTIEKRLGAGRLGTSFLARQQGLGELYVIKQIFSDLTNNDVLKGNLSRLVEVLSARKLPNVAVYDRSISTFDEFYLVSPYIDGVTIREIFACSDIHPLASLYILRSLVDALVGLHRTQFSFQEGGVHGSLWPDNVFLTSQSEVKIKDVGTWQAPRHSLGQGSVSLVDCYRYLSPGHLTGRITPHSDIFSVGVLMYELLSSRQLFDGSGLMDTVRQIESAADRVTSGIRAIFGVVCQRCMLAGTETGYDTMAELAKDLKRLLPDSRIDTARVRLSELLVVIRDNGDSSVAIEPLGDLEMAGASLKQEIDSGEDVADTQISLTSPSETMARDKRPAIARSDRVLTQVESIGDVAADLSLVKTQKQSPRPAMIFGGQLSGDRSESGSSDLQQIIDEVLVRPPTNSLNIDLDRLDSEEQPEMQLSSEELEVLPAQAEYPRLGAGGDSDGQEPEENGSWIRTVWGSIRSRKK